MSMISPSVRLEVCGLIASLRQTIIDGAEAFDGREHVEHGMILGHAALRFTLVRLETPGGAKDINPGSTQKK